MAKDATTTYLLDDPAATLAFLMETFSGYKRDDDCIVLPRLDLVSPYGPYNYNGGHPVSYGKALKVAISGMGKEPYTITIGGYNDGLTIFDADIKPVFNVGDAFVIGNEPIRGDHDECARCAYEIVARLIDAPSGVSDVIVDWNTTDVLIEHTAGGWVYSYTKR